MLVVDDVEINRLILRELFSGEYEVLEASNGSEALAIINGRGMDLSVVLLDVVMPVMDGLCVLKDMNHSGLIRSIPVILITSEDNDIMSLESYNLGASDVMHKPFNAAIVTQRVKNIIELYTYKNHLEDKLAEQKGELLAQEGRIRQMNASLIDTLSATVEFRNVESGQHIKRTRILLRMFMESIQSRYPFTNEQLELISSAGALHDIGKISIPDAVLLKPGKLTEEEFEIMKTHTIKGGEILETLDLLQDKEYFQYCYDIARHHHERWDGGGYPDGLKGDQIPIWAQAAAMVDVYDALTSKRVYKEAFSHEKAVSMILGGECGAFNPLLLDSLKRIAPQLKEVALSISD
jgi:putative two-component system response regulator